MTAARTFMGLFLGAALALAPTLADACECAKMAATDLAVKKADAVFVGETTRIEQAFSRSGEKVWKITVDVTRSFKGKAEGRVELFTPASKKACASTFRPQREYVVFAYNGIDGLETNRCTRTSVVELAGETMAVLDPPKADPTPAPTPAPTPKPVVAKVDPTPAPTPEPTPAAKSEPQVLPVTPDPDADPPVEDKKAGDVPQLSEKDRSQIASLLGEGSLSTPDVDMSGMETDVSRDTHGTRDVEAQDVTEVDSKGAGSVFVRIAGGKGQIHLDGRLIGTAPVRRGRISVGRHEIRMRDPITGYEAFDTISIESGRETEVTFHREKREVLWKVGAKGSARSE